jgi:hypothetical protein
MSGKLKPHAPYRRTRCPQLTSAMRLSREPPAKSGGTAALGSLMRLEPCWQNDPSRLDALRGVRGGSLHQVASPTPNALQKVQGGSRRP